MSFFKNKFCLRDKCWFKDKLIGTALISAAGGMILIIILPKVTLGILLALTVFLLGLWLICSC